MVFVLELSFEASVEPFEFAFVLVDVLEEELEEFAVWLCDDVLEEPVPDVDVVEELLLDTVAPFVERPQNVMTADTPSSVNAVAPASEAATVSCTPEIVAPEESTSSVAPDVCAFACGVGVKAMVGAYSFV